MCELAAYGLGKNISLREAGTVDEFIGLMDADYFDGDTQAFACEALSRFAANSDNRQHIIDRGGIEAAFLTLYRRGQTALVPRERRHQHPFLEAEVVAVANLAREVRVEAPVGAAAPRTVFPPGLDVLVPHRPVDPRVVIV